MALESVKGVLERLIARGELAGAVALAFRDGRAEAIACGWADLEARRSMTRTTLVRIASMTKPITSVAALRLHEAGLFDLEEPITRWAPEFAAMRVLRVPGGDLADAEPAARPITFADLLTHRAGLTYGAFHRDPLRSAYRAALGADIDSDRSPDAWIAALARLPLVDQPGRGFHYGVSTDLLGLLLARIEGRPLAEVLRRRVLEPLEMADTTFAPTSADLARAARMYGFDAEGRLELRPVHPPGEPAFLERRPADLAFASAGAGLWSTADDYLRFARLFVEEGASAGVRLLKISTLRRMTANWLTAEQIAAARILGAPVFAGQGFGLGVAVVLDPERAGVERCRGGLGTVGWPGAFGGWWQADPTTGTVLVLLAQNALDPEGLARGLGLGVFEAAAALQGAYAD